MYCSIAKSYSDIKYVSYLWNVVTLNKDLYQAKLTKFHNGIQISHSASTMDYIIYSCFFQ